MTKHILQLKFKMPNGVVFCGFGSFATMFNNDKYQELQL